MDKYQQIPFPKREWEMVKNDLNTKGFSSSTRCCKELGKYKTRGIYREVLKNMPLDPKLNGKRRKYKLKLARLEAGSASK